jgi:hypothetical protein
MRGNPGAQSRVPQSALHMGLKYVLATVASACLKIAASPRPQLQLAAALESPFRPTGVGMEIQSASSTPARTIPSSVRL